MLGVFLCSLPIYISAQQVVELNVFSGKSIIFREPAFVHLTRVPPRASAGFGGLRREQDEGVDERVQEAGSRVQGWSGVQQRRCCVIDSRGAPTGIHEAMLKTAFCYIHSFPAPCILQPALLVPRQKLQKIHAQHPPAAS